MSDTQVVEAVAIQQVDEDVIPNLFIEEATEDTAPAVDQVDPVVEPPKAEAVSEETKDAQTGQDRVSSRIAAAKRAEIKAAKERASITKERAELDSYRAKIEKIKTNPLEALNEVGLDPDEFLKRVISDGKPSPESELGEIKRAIQEQKEENSRLKQEREQYFHGQAVEKAKDNFMTLVEARHADFQHLLSEYTPDEIREYGFEVAKRDGAAYKEEHGVDIPDEVIAVRLNEFAKSRFEKRDAWRSRVMGSVSAGSANVGLGKVGSATTVSKANTPRTLTNGQASQKPSAPLGAKKTAEEVDAECVRILEAAMKAG